MSCILCGGQKTLQQCTCATIYCSKECSRKDWEQHKFICKDTHLDSGLEWPEKADFREEYEVGRKLGSGSFGTVVLIRHKTSAELSVLKIIRSEEHLQNDVTRLRKLSRFPQCNLHISCYYEHFKAQLGPGGTWVYAIRMQYLAGGDLREFGRRLPVGTQNDHIPAILKGALLGLKFLHSLDIIHADIKPANLVFRSLDDASSIVLVDFGLACERKCESNRGTPTYQGPEVLRPDAVPGKANDVFALSASFYALFGEPDWVDTTTYKFDRTEHANAVWELGLFTNASNTSAGEVLVAMFAYRPRDRPTAKQALALL